MLSQTTGSAAPAVQSIVGPAEILAMQQLAREVPVVPSVRDFALTIVRASRPGQAGSANAIDRAIRLGASPRAAQALLLGGKVLALARGRMHVTRQDIVDIARPVMSHRILMDFRAAAEGHTKASLLERLIDFACQRAAPRVSFWTAEVLRSQRDE
jgi:MoxR-like ATPase